MEKFVVFDLETESAEHNDALAVINVPPLNVSSPEAISPQAKLVALLSSYYLKLKFFNGLCSCYSHMGVHTMEKPFCCYLDFLSRPLKVFVLSQQSYLPFVQGSGE